MRTLNTLMAGLATVAGLTACNSLDALTPPENVGDPGGYQSAPVNTADLEMMERQQPVVRQAAPAVSHDAPVRMGSSMPAPDVGETAYATGSESYRDPAGSLDAQASALTQAPASAIDPPETAAAFPSSDTTVRETEAAVEERRAPREEEPVREEAAIAPKAPAAPAGTVRFLPIIGAPVEAVRPLSEQLGKDARANGLTIRTAQDPATRHMLKGYFSAFKDGKKTTIVYVWDVLDGAGNRLHRIQGQDSVEAAGPDLWSGIPAATMRDIATKSIESYLDWQRSQAG